MTVTGNTKATKEAHLETCIKEISISKKSNHDAARNENINLNSETVWFRYNRPNETVPHISMSTIFPVQLDENNVSYNKLNAMHNGDKVYYNEKEINGLINSESLLCLRNYLLFSCARDCSMLIAFRELKP